MWPRSKASSKASWPTRGRHCFTREVIKVKRYKAPISKNKLGDMKVFHKNLEKKAALVLADTCISSNIQKQWESVMETDVGCRIVAPREFVYRQTQAGWLASTQAMANWFKENLEEIDRYFDKEYVGFKPDSGLKSLPPKNRLLVDSAAIEKVINDSFALSRTITTEVQRVITECREDLQRKKEAANNEYLQIGSGGDGQSEPLGIVMEEEGDEGLKDEDFNTEFRHSVNGYRNISQYAIRESKDSNTMFENVERPAPKLAVNSRAPMPSMESERSRTAMASTSTMRIARGGKKGGQSGKPLQTYFKSRKDGDDKNLGDEDFN